MNGLKIIDKALKPNHTGATTPATKPKASPNFSICSNLILRANSSADKPNSSRPSLTGNKKSINAQNLSPSHLTAGAIKSLAFCQPAINPSTNLSKPYLTSKMVDNKGSRPNSSTLRNVSSDKE